MSLVWDSKQLNAFAARLMPILAELGIDPGEQKCDRDLPQASDLARICTYECTFCVDCVDIRLGGRCPNCGGTFAPRPIRPPEKLEEHPASTMRVIGSHEACSSAQ